MKYSKEKWLIAGVSALCNNWDCPRINYLDEKELYSLSLSYVSFDGAIKGRIQEFGDDVWMNKADDIHDSFILLSIKPSLWSSYEIK